MPTYNAPINIVRYTYKPLLRSARSAFLEQQREVAQTLLGEDANSLADAANRGQGSLFYTNKGGKFVAMTGTPDLEQMMLYANANSLYVRSKDNTLHQIGLESTEDAINLRVSEPLTSVPPPRPSFYFFKNLLSPFVKSFKEEVQTYQQQLAAHKEAHEPLRILDTYGINLNPNAPQKNAPAVNRNAVKAPVMQAPEVKKTVVQESEVKKPVEQEPVVQEPVVQAPVVNKAEEQPSAGRLIFEDVPKAKKSEKEVSAGNQSQGKQPAKPAAKPLQTQSMTTLFQLQTSAPKNEPLNPSKMDPAQFKAHLDSVDAYSKESLVATAMMNKNCTPDQYYEAVAKTLEAQVAHTMLDQAKNMSTDEEREDFFNTQKKTYTSLAAGLRSFVRQKIDPELVNNFCRQHNPLCDEAFPLTDAAEELLQTGVQEYLDKTAAENLSNKEAQQSANQPPQNQAQIQQAQLQPEPEPKAAGLGMGGLG